MKKQIRLLSLLLSLCLVLGALTACGGTAGESDQGSAAPAEASAADASEAAQTDTGAAPEQASAAETEAEDGSLLEAAETSEEAETSDLEIVRTYTEAEPMPLVDEPVTLTAWDYVVPPVMEVIQDYGTQGQVYVELQKRTGVTLDFTTANLLTATDDMALMIAANELPDVIFNFGMFNSYNDDDLIDGDIIVNYSDYEDIMPNYFDIINNNPSIARDIYTEQGNVSLAANIASDLTPSSGPAIRQDWLDADGLETPVTVDDLHEVMKTFQTENDSTYPFWVSANGNSSVAGAYGISYNGDNNGIGGWIWNEEDGMQYCLPMDGFRDYVQLLADWYAEGLISPDFVSKTMSGTAQDDEMVGANGHQGAGLVTTSVMSLTNLAAYLPESDLQPIRAVVQNEGDLCGFDDAGTSRIGRGGAAVACSCPDVELACRIIDYFYSDEGILLANYGVEGVSFEYNDDGEPELTELVTNNPEGKAFGLCLILYTSSTPCSIDIKARNNFGYTDAQVKALELWLRNTDSMMAPGSVWDVDAQTEYSTIATDLSSFVTTNVLQFITGAKPMSDWDAFVDDVLASFDIERMKELNDQAVEAYLGA